VGSNLAGGHGCLSLVSVVCCQVEFPASGRSLVQMSPTECGVSECDRKVSIMRRPWPTRGCCAMGGGGGHEVPVPANHKLSVCSPPFSAQILIFRTCSLDILHIDSWKSLKHFLIAVLRSSNFVNRMWETFSSTVPQNELPRVVRFGLRGR